jgi:hypothetical protein
VGSLLFLHPPTVVVAPASGGRGGAMGVKTGICIGIPFVWGGRDGLGTISSGCRYQTGMESTMLVRVSIAAT